MAKTLSKWYVSLIVLPILITYLTNHFSLPLLLSDWKLSIIFSLAITVVILGIELKIEMDRSKTNDLSKKSDMAVIKRLLDTLDIKMLQEEVLQKDSWNGYLHEAISKIIDYQYKSRLLENKLIDKTSQKLFDSLNHKLMSFTDFSAFHMCGSNHGYLIPFKDSEFREKAMKDSQKIDELAKDVYKELEVLIKYLKRKGYLN
ncbi:hypothetical protein [Sphingobacterium gobiense]|nr:hypothetical protein [Sphingobacterium gobiense]